MTKKTFTLNDLLPQTSMMEIKHPTEGPMGIYLELVGQDSSNFRKVVKKIAQKQFDTEKNGTQDINEVEHNSAELIASCIVGWDCPEVFGEYSPSKAIEHMLSPGLTWLRNDVEAYIKDRANFFRKSKG